MKNIKSAKDLINKGYPLISLLIISSAELISVNLKIYQEYTVYILLINSVFFANLTSKLIIKTMSHVII